MLMRFVKSLMLNLHRGVRRVRQEKRESVGEMER